MPKPNDQTKMLNQVTPDASRLPCPADTSPREDSETTTWRASWNSNWCCDQDESKIN